MGALVVLFHSLSIPLRQGLSLSLGLAFSQLGWKPASPVILLSPPPLWICWGHQAYHWGTGGQIPVIVM